MKKILCAAVCAALSLSLFGCSGEEQPGPGGSTTRRAVSSGELQFTQPAEGAPIATISTTMGDITVVLYPDQAPMAVENFTGLANSGYYNQMPISRIVEGFCVQTGLGAADTGEGTTTWGQGAFPNEITDALHHYAGALATANGGQGGTGNLSQFYFVQCAQDSVYRADASALKEAGVREEVADAYQSAGGAPYLDGQDTVFGQVIAGMDVLDAIAAVPCDENGVPTGAVTVNSVTIGAYSAAVYAPQSGAQSTGGASSASGQSAPASAPASAAS